jgi:hypothetical protein
MENLPVPTRAQSNFLRTLKQDPNLPAKQWPSNVILRRWLRHQGFRRALTDLQCTNRFFANYELATAGAYATAHLRAFLATPKQHKLTPDQLAALLNIVRLSHASQRIELARQSRRPATTTTPAAALPSPTPTPQLPSPATPPLATIEAPIPAVPAPLER